MNRKGYSTPFMYIDQPEFQAAVVTVQSDYYSSADMRPSVQEELQRSKSNVKEDVKFKDLSIKGKIQYLIELPDEMPDIHCEVQTDDEYYRGIILEETETEIMLRVFGKGYQHVSKNMITNIILIGF